MTLQLQQNGDGVSLPEENKVVISTSVDVLDDNGNNIGFLQQISRTDARPMTPIRHLAAGDAGRMVEQSPGVELNTLNVTGYALYNTGASRASLLNRITGQEFQSGGIEAPFRSLNSQFIPFHMTEQWTHPGNTALLGETIYGDCYLTNYTRPVSIATVNIVETANIQATWVE